MNRIEHIRDASGVTETRITWSVPLNYSQEEAARGFFEELEGSTAENFVEALQESAAVSAQDDLEAEHQEAIEALEDKLQDYRISCAALEKRIAELEAKEGTSCAA